MRYHWNFPCFFFFEYFGFYTIWTSSETKQKLEFNKSEMKEKRKFYLAEVDIRK